MDNQLETMLRLDREELYGTPDAAEAQLRRTELHELLTHECGYETVRRWLTEMGTFSAMTPDVSAIALYNLGHKILTEIAVAHPQAYLRLCADAVRTLQQHEEI